MATTFAVVPANAAPVLDDPLLIALPSVSVPPVPNPIASCLDTDSDEECSAGAMVDYYNCEPTDTEEEYCTKGCFEWDNFGVDSCSVGSHISWATPIEMDTWGAYYCPVDEAAATAGCIEKGVATIGEVWVTTTRGSDNAVSTKACFEFAAGQYTGLCSIPEDNSKLVEKVSAKIEDSRTDDAEGTFGGFVHYYNDED